MPFRDVIGHRTLVSLLARSIARGSLPPSLIFAGPTGVGKRLTAVAVAQTLNCLSLRPKPDSPTVDDATTSRGASGSTRTADPEIPPIDACGKCAACTRIARGVHPDVLLIEPGDSGSIKIDPIRDAIDRASYRPFEGRRRVVIIDEADALVSQAQNALLKTLEEPPSASVFILVTSRPDALLATVLSRCPRLRFRPLEPAEVAAALIKQGSAEREARAIAAAADGSVAQALEASAGELVEAREVAARVLLQAAATADPRRRLESAKDLLPKTSTTAADRDQLARYLRAMASLVRDVALVGAGGDAAALANPDVEPAIGGLTALRGERAVETFAAIDRALAALQRNVGLKTVVDWVLVNV
jgi:DNA polymerase-3 subunit delta'